MDIIGIIGTLLVLAIAVFVITSLFKKKKSNQKEVKIRLGKWIGGGLGWAFGGPIGAILGFALGSMFDGVSFSKEGLQTTQRGDFHVSLLILSAAVMKADGKVLKSELDYVRDFLIRQFGVDEATQQLLLLREVLKQDYQIQDVCAQIRNFMEYPSRLQLIHFLFGISQADSRYHPKEVETIERISENLGIPREEYRSIRAMFIKDLHSSYEILEVISSATDDEIKKSYRRLAVQHHPDKVAHLGEDIRKAATEKFQKINAAYEEIKKQREIVN
ncbi:MAG: molecular chaperone DnaJ [Bacteroidetes bacterium]|nr:molecular chaperone DnaJ [Bacteroidota bacterium]